MQADIARDAQRMAIEPRGACRATPADFGRDYNDRMSKPDYRPFDTHRFVKRMTEAGMPLPQAEALADEQGGLVSSHLATKQDTGELKDRLTNVESDVGELKGRLTNVERDVGELKVGVAVVRAELAMVKWMVSGTGAGMLLLLVRTFWPT